METLTKVSNGIYGSIAEYLSANAISPESVDNYELNDSDKAQLAIMGVTTPIKSQIVSIFYKDLDRKPILDSGVTFRRFRLNDADIANGMPKYLSPAGSTSHLYIPMLFKKVYDSAVKKTIYITEGEKKADVACAHNVPCLALHGIFNFSESSDSQEKRLLQELKYLVKALSVETVVVIYDSDGDLITKDEVNAKEAKTLHLVSTGRAGSYVRNPQVRKAAYELAVLVAKELQVKTSHGFCKHIIEDKTSGNVKYLNKALVKNGLDDWLINSPQAAHNFLSFLEDKAIIPLVAQEKKYEALGQISTPTETTAVIYRKDLDELKFAPYSKFTRDTISMLIGESDAVRYHRESDSGLLQFDTVRASTNIKTECDSAGSWSTDSMKEAGLWKTSTGQLVVNTKDSLHVISGNELQKTKRFIRDSREYFVAKRDCSGEITEHLDAVDLPFPTNAEVRNALATLHALLSPFYFEQHNQQEVVYMLVSWMLGQIYTGITQIRPHIYIDGSAGCGKTTILKVMARALKGHAHYISNGRDSSLAGIKGMIGKSATTMIIDEMEISDREAKFGADNKLESLMGIIKASYSSDTMGVDSVKGTQSGGYRTDGAKAGFLFASLDKGSVDMATETRILTLTVRNKTSEETSAHNGYVLGTAIDSPEYYKLAEKAGAVLMRFFMSDEVHEGYERSLKVLKKLLRKRLITNDRMVNTFSYLYAPLLPVLIYSNGNLKDLKSLVKGLIRIIGNSHKTWTSVTRPIGYELLDKILHASARKATYVEDINGDKRLGVYEDTTISRLIAEVVEGEDQDARNALANMGIYFINKEYATVYMHNNVMTKLTGSDAKKFKTLETIKSATKEHRRRFNSAQYRVIGIPYSAILGD